MQPLLNPLRAFRYLRRAATWRSGYAAVCKTVYPGSIPGVASNLFNDLVRLALAKIDFGHRLATDFVGELIPKPSVNAFSSFVLEVREERGVD